METHVINSFRGLKTEDERGGSPENAHPDSRDFWLRAGNTSVRNRKGFDNLFSAEGAADYAQVVRTKSGYIFARRGTTLARITTSGEVATTTVAADSLSHATIGIPSTTYDLFANGSNTNIISYTSGGGFVAGSAAATVDGVGSRAMPTGYWLVADRDSNRLVVAGAEAGPHSATSSTSHVWFSEPGNPFAWNTDNYVILSPGDGEGIVGAVEWNGQLFVFKPSTLFIFYAEDVDVDGNPVFRYRTVPLTQAQVLPSAITTATGTITSGPDAVYYLGQDAIWATTGDVPFPVSDVFKESRNEPTGTAYSGLWVSGTDTIGSISYYHGRIFLTILDPTLSTVYIFDLATGDLIKWRAGINGIVAPVYGLASGSNYLLSSGYGSGQGSYLFRWSDGVTNYDDDNGTAISSTWKSQWSDLDYYGEKRVSNVEVWGSGAVKLTVLSDFYDSGVQGKTTSSVSMTLGASDDNNFRRPAKAVFKESISGNHFSLKFDSNSSNDDWQIDRVVIFYEMRDPRATRADSNN